MIGTYFRLMKYGENENGSQQCAYNGEFFFRAVCLSTFHGSRERAAKEQREAYDLSSVR